MKTLFITDLDGTLLKRQNGVGRIEKILNRLISDAAEFSLAKGCFMKKFTKVK